MEIERKWWVRTMPDLTNHTPLRDERYYLYADNDISLRFQKRGDKFELERMEKVADLTRKQEKLFISKNEFEALTKIAKGPIIRDSFLLQDANPQITLKVYDGPFKGLERIEVEFGSLEEAKTFSPPDWFGPEMTDSVLASDSKLVNMTRDEFIAVLFKENPRF